MRSRRLVWALVAWFVVIGGITSLVVYASTRLLGIDEVDPSSQYSPGPLAFGLITFFIMGMGLIIAPTFTATSINGDRGAGTLATLQATRLSALEIAAGKLVAAWLASLVFLVVALPFLAWAMVLGQISLWQVTVCFGVVFIEVAVVCAIGLGWSALISRTAGSVVLTYLSVVALTIISAMLLALLTPLATEERATVRVWGLSDAETSAYNEAMDKYWAENPEGEASAVPSPPIDKCAWHEVVDTRYRVDRIWWISVVNPFVIVADAAPLPPDAYDDLSSYVGRSADPLAAIRYGVRNMAQPPATERDECLQLYSWTGSYNVMSDDDGNITVTTLDGTPVNVETPVKRRAVTVDSPLWPWGMGSNVLIGLGFLFVAVRRLRIPYGTLPKGTRVA
jgi:ABC-type transport system involved in multi-copper enzyme maturation permease subunit